jgi:hypothetical protein
MQLRLKNVSNNFTEEHKIVWDVKEIILKNIERYAQF